MTSIVLTGDQTTDIKIWGFSHSPYVRAVRMLLAEKGVVDYEQVAVDVIAGEARPPNISPAIRSARSPCSTSTAIASSRPTSSPATLTRRGPTLVPSDPLQAARMDMAISMIDKYAYTAIDFGVLAYCLFPDFVGGKDEIKLRQGLIDGKKVFVELMKIKDDDPWLAGPAISVADLYLGPILAYICLTPHRDEFLALPGVAPW